MTSISQSFETSVSASTSDASTAQAAIDAMETQVVLDSDGLTVRAADGDPDVAVFGSSVTLYDGIGDASTNRRLLA